MAKRRKWSMYKKLLVSFTVFLLICAEFLLVYVNNSLKAYEKSDIDNYMNSLLKDIRKSSQNGSIEKYIKLANISSKYEKKSSLKKGYKELLKDSKLDFTSKKEKNTYDLTADGKVFATVKLDDSKIEKRLGLLTFNVWEIDELLAYNDEGLYSYDFYMNSDYKLFINDNEVKNEDLIASEMIEGYEDAYDKVDLPKQNHYRVSGLTYKPVIEVKDKDGKKVEVTYKDNKYYANDYIHASTMEEAYKHLAHDGFDPIKFAENWSLFMTADLDGPRWGFYTLTPNLIEGTQMYNKAYSWATLVDIQFTSIHTLDKEPFTNEKISNITIYNDNAFSVEVYLEKNMTLNDGQKRVDKLHDIYSYVYYDGAYRLMAMKSVSE